MHKNNRFLQFEVWKDCKNGCSFCFNRGLPDMDKIESMKFIIEKLNDEDTMDYNEIGFIGGEFFDDQLENEEVRKLFYEMFELVFKRVETGIVDKICVATSMIFPSFHRLGEFLEYAEKRNCIDKILLCTSYDTIGRFHTHESLEMWQNNVMTAKSRHKLLKIHVETIITQDFIDKVMSGEFDIRGFSDGFGVTVDYLEPNTGSFFDGKCQFSQNVPNFLPRRSSFLKFLKKTCIEEKSIELFKLFSKEIRSDRIFLIVNGRHVDVNGRHAGDRWIGIRDLPIKPMFGYVDSEVDMADDVIQFRESYG